MSVGSMDDLAAHSLDLVNRELGNTLDAARRELEDYVDGNSGRDALMRTADLLHLARGALKIVEIHGAALLAEEMEHTCRRFAETDENEKAEAGVEALTRAMVQLPAYLERLLSGGKDVALVLLPLLNDLRVARDKPSLSEGTLLLLNTGPFERHLQAQHAPTTVAGTGREFERAAQRLRPSFQTALLGWIRGVDVTRNVDELLRISTGLEKAAATEQVRQLWAVLAAVLIAIRDNGLEASVTLKRLIGQADRQLKRLIDGGEAALVDTPPVDLVNSLLYYVARAASDHERIRAVRQTYNLSEMLPGEEQIEQAREGLAGPSVKLMRTVAQAIKEDLGAVKDVLDIFVRTGMQDIGKLEPQLEMLKKISDTLGVLGLEKARNHIQHETKESSAIIAENKVNGPHGAREGRRNVVGRGRRSGSRTCQCSDARRWCAGTNRVRRGHAAPASDARGHGRVHRQSRQDQGVRHPANRPAGRCSRARSGQAAASGHRCRAVDAQQDESCQGRGKDRRSDRHSARAEHGGTQTGAFGAPCGRDRERRVLHGDRELRT